jgi:death-on-curing protein
VRYLSLEELIYIYTQIIQHSGGRPGIKDESLLESTLAKPLVNFEGEELYPDIFTKIAVLIYTIINNRPFIEGNKRTAIMAALLIFRANGYSLQATQDQLVDLAREIESGSYKVDHLVNWLRKNAVLI